jgi:quercetin dioxygenase-like cupin family protein
MPAFSPLDLGTLTTSVAAIKEKMGPPPWAVRSVETDQYVVTVICQAPGWPNDTHYHIYDESWLIWEGELSWQFEHSPERHFVKQGDFVFAPKGHWHHIEVHGDRPAIRIAVSVKGEGHRHDKPGCHPAPRPGA